jgi:hypothetical protein
VRPRTDIIPGALDIRSVLKIRNQNVPAYIDLKARKRSHRALEVDLAISDADSPRSTIGDAQGSVEPNAGHKYVTKGEELDLPSIGATVYGR